MIRFVPFLIISLLLHGTLLVAKSPWTDPFTLPGDPTATEEYMFVDVVAEKNQTATAPTPASTDSIASKDSQRIKEVPTEQEDQKEPAANQEEPERESIVKEHASPQPVIARTTQEPKADFISSSLQSQDPPETSEHLNKLQKAKDRPEQPEKEQSETKEDHEKKRESESQQAIASISQVASRRSAFHASRGHDLADFKARVVAAIKKASYYPQKARRKRQTGKVVVRFRIWKDGRVDSIEIVSSSGSKVLEQAAKKILHNAAKDFPAVPDFFRGTFMVYAVPIIFRDNHHSKK